MRAALAFETGATHGLCIRYKAARCALLRLRADQTCVLIQVDWDAL